MNSTDTQYTLRDLLLFCIKNRKRRGFKNHSYVQIASHLVKAAENKMLLHVKDEHGLCAVCTFSDYGDRLYVHHIVAIRSGFASLVKHAVEHYPGRLIIGQRGQKLRTFTIRNLCQMIHRH